MRLPFDAKGVNTRAALPPIFSRMLDPLGNDAVLSISRTGCRLARANATHIS
jgi:hypothetical protein